MECQLSVRDGISYKNSYKLAECPIAMELTESKVKCLVNGQNLNKLNDETFNEIMRIAESHVCGKIKTEGM